MEKLNEVIAGLEACMTDRCCTNCPYNGTGSRCVERVTKDALELLKKLSEDNARLNCRLKVARVERDAERAKMTRIVGMVGKDWLEQVRPDWYERLSELDYEYNPVKDGMPWYRAEAVWNCIEETPGNHPEFGAHMDEEVSDE
jgi:hypothetical protein